MLTVEQRARAKAIYEERITARKDRAAMRKVGEVVIPYIASVPAAINEATVIIPEWAPGTFAVNDVRLHQGIPYKCIQPHDSTGNPGWTPITTPALWMQYHGTSIETARPWIKPGHAEDRYRYDEYMVWTDGTIQRCIAPDGTTYSPTEYPAHWERVQGAGEPTEPTEPEPTEPEPVDEWPTWTPGTYAKNAQVTHNGKRYISQVDNNHWEPGAAGVYDNIWMLIP